MKKSRTVRPTEQLDERQPTRGRRFNTGALRAPSRPHGVAGRDGGQVPSSSGGGRYRSAAPAAGLTRRVIPASAGRRRATRRRSAVPQGSRTHALRTCCARSSKGKVQVQEKQRCRLSRKQDRKGHGTRADCGNDWPVSFGSTCYQCKRKVGVSHPSGQAAPRAGPGRPRSTAVLMPFRCRRRGALVR